MSNSVYEPSALLETKLFVARSSPTTPEKEFARRLFAHTQNRAISPRCQRTTRLLPGFSFSAVPPAPCDPPHKPQSLSLLIFPRSSDVFCALREFSPHGQIGSLAAPLHTRRGSRAHEVEDGAERSEIRAKKPRGKKMKQRICSATQV